MTKSDRKEFVKRLAEEAEKAAGRQDLKSLYRINKMLNNGFPSSDFPVKDAKGNVLSKEPEKLARYGRTNRQ